MRTLTVLYDGECGLCGAVKRALSAEPAHVPLEFLDARRPDTARRFPGAVPTGALELVAIDDAGGIYEDEDAYLMVLWAVKRYRALALRLANPVLKPLAKRFFSALSGSRGAVSRILGLAGDGELTAAVEAAAVAAPMACDTPRRTAMHSVMRERHQRVDDW